MKRYVCTVAAGLLLALVSTGTAAGGLPILDGQLGEQKTEFGNQTVGEQKNDADVTQAQGNGNLNIAPAVAIFGDAETTNAQGNGNTATADVDQSNSVDQTQSSEQKQSLDQGGTACCDGQSQTGEQKVYGGDQTVGEQKNDADVNQYQGNGNVNVSPAIAIFGDAKTKNAQGNGNEADATVTQSNEATQSQSATQKQWLDQDGGDCCKSTHGCKSHDPCSPHKGDNGYPKENCCEDGSSQTGEQKTNFGDQYVGEQKNDADVVQKQGNGNVNVSPAIGLGGGKNHGSCDSKCKGSWKQPSAGNADTANYQGNWNEANANVGQSNSAAQSQTSYQRQSIVDTCKGLV